MQVWFKNRRAKERKDAKVKCLGNTKLEELGEQGNTGDEETIATKSDKSEEMKIPADEIQEQKLIKLQLSEMCTQKFRKATDEKTSNKTNSEVQTSKQACNADKKEKSQYWALRSELSQDKSHPDNSEASVKTSNVCTKIKMSVSSSWNTSVESVSISPLKQNNGCITTEMHNPLNRVSRELCTYPPYSMHSHQFSQALATSPGYNRPLTLGHRPALQQNSLYYKSADQQEQKSPSDRSVPKNDDYLNSKISNQSRWFYPVSY